LSITYFPFDSGQGANVTEVQWTKMAQHWLGTGVIQSVLNKLEVFADSTGMQVKVKSGAAWIKGHYFESDSEEVLPIGTADPVNPRIDRVVVRLDWNENTIGFGVLQGTAAATPTAPQPTQNTARWEFPLAQVTVPAGALTINSVDITFDDRVYTEVFDKLPPKNANESGDLIPMGITSSTIAIGVLGYPETFGLLLNIKNAKERLTQWFYSHGNNGTYGAWFRHWYTGSGWTPFYKVVITQQENWIAASLLNGATSIDITQYMKDQLGFVHLRGRIQNFSITNGTVLFVLPEGYRPLRDLYYIGRGYNGTTSVPVYFLIQASDGTVRLSHGNTTGTSSLDLGNIEFATN
jgi:hypothetical protein